MVSPRFTTYMASLWLKWFTVWWVGSFPLSSQAPTHVEVDLGCDNYCSQLWASTDQTAIARRGSLAHNFTSQISGMKNKDYWERLHDLHMYSQERRRERYMIILLWKIAQGYVEGYDISFTSNPRRGRGANVKMVSMRSPPAVKRARQSSMSVGQSSSTVSQFD